MIITKAVAVMIFDPPDPPVTMTTSPFWSTTTVGLMDDRGLFPFWSTTTVGLMDDRGLFPGSIQLAELEGATHESLDQLGLSGATHESLDQLGLPGMEKSSMRLLNIIPVLFPILLEPHLQCEKIHRLAAK